MTFFKIIKISPECIIGGYNLLYRSHSIDDTESNENTQGSKKYCNIRNKLHRNCVFDSKRNWRYDLRIGNVQN